MSLPSREKAIRFSDTMYGSIGSIYITGAGYVAREFKGVSPNSSFGWQELVWKKSPTRSTDFAFTGMDDIPVGLVARCEIDVSFMTPDDYIAMRKILKQRHFLVTFYDMDECEWYTRDMYCTESSKSRFLILDKSILGTVDVKLKFVGTNLDSDVILDIYGNETTKVKTFDIKYIENGVEQTSRKKSVNSGSQVRLEERTIEANPNPNSQFLAGWCEKDSNDNVIATYGLGQSITVWRDITLYPSYVQSQNSNT